MTQIHKLARSRRKALTEAARALRAGELAVVPTDTVYGLAADAFQPAATEAVFRVKGRSRGLPLPVMVASADQAWALCSVVPDGAKQLAAAYWPGAVTLVLPVADGLAWDLGDGQGAVGIRVPAHDHLVALIEAVGPLAVTSANVTGEPTPATAAAIAKRFGDKVAVYLDGGKAAGDVPSTIVDLTGPSPVVLREGTIAATEIEDVVAGDGEA